MDLTRDEKMLIMLYSPGTRMGLCGVLKEMKEQLQNDETELLSLTESVLKKLSDMDDETFENLNLSLGFFEDWRETMNAKARFYSGVARETINRITANRENWTSFLTTMARNYEFTYPEQVMIYAPGVPDATLCKPYEEWNTEQYRRYVKRGSKGIALFVMNQDKPYLRYVFDVSDTGVRRSSPALSTWKVTNENRPYIMEAMEAYFSGSGKRNTGKSA